LLQRGNRSIKKHKTLIMSNLTVNSVKRQSRKVGVAGGFINQMMGNNDTLPVVGEGATILMYSDREAHEVIEVSDNGMQCVIRKMDAKNIGTFDDRMRKVFFIYGKTSTTEREEIRAIVEKEKNSITIASYGTFSTGINIRNIHNIVLASPSKSRIRVLQSIGRGLRQGDNKDSVLIFDIADDMTFRNQNNFTLNHFQERINIYNTEQFNYEITKVKLR
jgi:predicted helicase